MYIIQMMIHAMREECGALGLRSRQPILNCVIMKEGCLGAQPQQTLHNVHGISDATRQSGAKEPSRRGNSWHRGLKAELGLARLRPCNWAGVTGSDGHREVIQGRLREGSMARGRARRRK